MGMFDNIKIERNLPYFEVINKDYLSDLYQDEIIFQTKDFDKLLDTYIITEDGLLQIKESGRMSQNMNGHHLISFHGTFEFYTMKKNYWICYNAKFNEGICEEIKLIKFEYVKDGERTELTEKVKEKGDSN